MKRMKGRAISENAAELEPDQAGPADPPAVRHFHARRLGFGRIVALSFSVNKVGE
jgi:hypothetical protein